MAISSDKRAFAGAGPAEMRGAIRAGAFRGDTSGLCGGYLQGNLVILPAAWASDFFRYCQRNPKPCPLLAVSDQGDPGLPALGAAIDVRSDLSGYRVFENGVLVEETADIGARWRDDLVSFVIGCSFSFEEALMAEGVEVRHVAQGRNVPMYRTTLQTTPAGPFRGELVVSMRPFSTADAIRAIQITSRFPEAHGAPVHFGDPAAIGVGDLARPDFGDRVDLRPGEVPLFWACGVTPQVAVGHARPPLCITHAPGHMLITDLRGAPTGLAA